MKRKGIWVPLGIVSLLVLVYALGPTMPRPVYNVDFEGTSGPAYGVEQLVGAAEAGIPNIRPGNESQVIWAHDSLKDKTPYCLLYLHGFSASPMEGNPVHKNVADHFGINAYIPRLAEHGLEEEDALLNMTPDRLWESAKDALSKALALGDEVIVMGTSTGGTLALKLAAEFPDKVNSLILCSPNIRIYDKTAALLANPWGLQIGRIVMGGDHRILEEDPLTDPYWNNKYRVEAIVYLQQLVKTTMRASVFKGVDQPVYLGCYYKDEENQDKVVSVEAMDWMFENLSTPETKKTKVAFPDAEAHVICCDLTSPTWKEVQKSIITFIDTVIVNN